MALMIERVAARRGDQMALVDETGAEIGDRVVVAQVRVHKTAQDTALNPQPLARWTNGIALAAVAIEQDQAKRPVAVHVQWQTTALVPTDYTVFVQLLDKAGKLLSQVDHPPQNGAYPTSTWQPGDRIEDEYRLATSSSSEIDAPWDRLIIGLYDGDQKRLLLQTTNENPTDFFVLARKEAAAP